jgi:PKD repeat protein
MGRPSRIVKVAITTFSLVAGMLAVPVLTAPAASAAPAPVMQKPAEAASVNALPTVQVDGVVWSQVIVGNTVYAGGNFTTATSAPTDPVQTSTPRSNLLAYDLVTGQLIPGFNVPLNGQAMTLTTSPDRTRLYVGGDFTTAGGTTHRRLVAISVATGQVIESFKPNLDARAGAVVATNTTVYVGGNVTVANGVTRQRFAAFNAVDGSLTGWAPTATGTVRAMTIIPDGSKIIVGGQFQQVNGTDVYGLAALNPVDGSLVPWAASGQVRAYGSTSGITSLRTFGNSVFGTGFTFGPLAVSNTREFEGTFSADAATGNLIWLQDCHGDSYDEYVAAGVVYSVSHAHDCARIGAFGEQAAGDERRALAFTEAATGTLNANTVSGYKNWAGTPSPTMINWFPDLNVGTFTGQSQAAWSVTGSGPYVVLGGEFPTVNGVAQRGLVRFATRPTSPGTQGPEAKGSNLVASAVSQTPGTVRLRFRSSWDRDDLNLTYTVVRNADRANPVYTTTSASTFWNRPILTFTDTGLTPGGTYTYRVYATDGDGNQVQGDLSTVTVAGGAASYTNQVLADQAALYYRLGDSAGPVVFDSVGTNDANALAGVTFAAPGALVGDTNTAATFNGTTTGAVASPLTSVTAAAPFTVEAWVRTSSAAGGAIVNYGNRVAGNSSSINRLVYVDSGGRIVFGVNNGAARNIASVNSYRDGAWHHVAATLGAQGMGLYVDGVLVASRADVTTSSNLAGYWRIGGDLLSGWPNRPTSNYLAGDIDEVAVYGKALDQATVLRHYQLGTATTPNVAPVAAFTASVTGNTVAVDGTASTDPDGTIASYSWNWGDSSPAGTAATATHPYATAGAYTVTLTVTDNRGGTHSVSKPITIAPNQIPVAAFVSTVDQQSVSVDGAASADPDGTIASYAWNWGDGSPAGSGSTATHTYSGAGVHTVTLTVTDNLGATGTISHDVTTTAAPNAAPIAAFTATSAGRVISVAGAGSTDSDGTIAAYSWNWGDGSAAGSGASASHPYAADGTYTVTLTVTDDDGATGTVSRDVTASSLVASDAFSRVLASGWGSADVAGAWTLNGGATKFNTNGQTGQVVLSTAGSGPSATLGGLSVRDFAGTVDFAVDKPATGGGVYTTVSTRRIGTSSYQFTLKYLATGAVTLAVARVVDGVATTLAPATTVSGLTYTAGDTVRMKFSAIGSSTTTLAVKAWKVGTAEPAAFALTRTDTTPTLQAAGSLNVQAYLSASSTNAPVTASFDNLSIVAG